MQAVSANLAGHDPLLTQLTLLTSSRTHTAPHRTAPHRTAPHRTAHFRSSSRSFVSADYLGCGRSKGTFIDGNLSRWVDDTIVLLDSLRDVSPTFSSKQKFVLVGGGVGGWVGGVLAIKRPDLVRGIVGLASDPDFTEDLLWQTFSDAEKDEIMTVGYKDIHWGSETYPISKSLIEDGRQNLILRGGDNSLDVHCPVRLIHAITDEEVPYTTALKLAACIKSRDVVCTFPKTGCHQLDDEEDFRRMREAVKDVIESSVEYDLRSPGSG